MTEIINDIFAQIDQIILWLKVTVYLVMGICVVWLIGFIRRNLGLDTHSIELRRIRRLLEGQNSDKLPI
jgi:predicted membrane channel-forming protein YqfA (hemolysin III family)